METTRIRLLPTTLAICGLETDSRNRGPVDETVGSAQSRLTGRNSKVGDGVAPRETGRSPEVRTRDLKDLRERWPVRGSQGETRPSDQFTRTTRPTVERVGENIVAVSPAAALARLGAVHVAKDVLRWRTVVVHPPKVREEGVLAERRGCARPDRGIPLAVVGRILVATSGTGGDHVETLDHRHGRVQPPSRSLEIAHHEDLLGHTEFREACGIEAQWRQTLLRAARGVNRSEHLVDIDQSKIPRRFVRR